MRELHLMFHLVLPDDADTAPVLENMAGREFPGVPGSWVVSATGRSEPHPRCGCSEPEPFTERSASPCADVEDSEAHRGVGLPTPPPTTVDDRDDDFDVEDYQIEDYESEDSDPGDADWGDVDPGD